MLRHPVVESLWGEVEQTLTGLGYHLVQMTFGGPASGATLMVYVDKPDGVTADDCAWVAEHLSVLLDSLDPLPGPYSLVVSSPGMDRPLGRDEEFAAAGGRILQIRYQTAAHRLRRLRGRLESVEGGVLRLSTEQGIREVPLDQVAAAHLIYDWDQYDWEGVR